MARVGPVRRLYDWVLDWAKTPYGAVALFLIAFCESSFFPIPPDILLIAMAVALPAKSFRYALICSAGSVLGGMFGYLIGWQFMGAVGERIIAFYGLAPKVDQIRELFMAYDAWAVAIAGFTPIPYKVFTISSGMFGINFPVFVIASALSRSARFFIIGGLIYRFGAGISDFIDKWFNILATAGTALLIAGFAAIKLFF